MTVSINQVNIGDTFQAWLDKTNQVINAMATQVITANNNANGAVNGGNLYMSSIVFANTLATAGLRGGNVQSAGNLAIISNASVNGTISATSQLLIGSNVIVNTSTVFIGNSTVNTVANSSKITTATINAATVNATTGTITIFNANTIAANTVTAGNFLANGTVLSVGNSSVNATINSTAFAVANGSGTFVVVIGDGVSNTFFNDKFKFQNNFTTVGLTTQTIDFYDKTIYRGTEYLLSCDDASNNAMLTKLLCTHNGSAAFTTEYGEVLSNIDLGNFSATTNATHVLMQFTPTVNNVTITFFRTQLGT